MRWLGLAALAAVLLLRPGTVRAQTPAPPGMSDRDCFLLIEQGGDTARKQASTDGVNYFAGGGVRLRCRGTSITMRSDSLASFAAKVIKFIGHMRYRDSSITLDADSAIYYEDGKRWEARGNVKTRNLETGSTLDGPSVDYFRKLPGKRDTTEMYAVGRPTIHYAVKDSAGETQKPYVIVGDRVRMKGDDLIWAAGKATVDRSDFQARSDSMRLDTGAGQDGTLLGDQPTMKGMEKDTFDLQGTRIDFTLQDKRLREVTAKGDAHAVSTDRDMVADTIRLVVREKKLRRTLAWGKQTRPFAKSAEYAVRGDSLVFESPAEVLEESRAFGAAWVGAKPDSATSERDWIVGDTVVARFRQRDGKTVLATLDADGKAKAYYRGRGEGKDGKSLSYTRGDFIRVTMKETGDEAVDRVDVRGQVDGIQLDPAPAKSTAPGAKPDSTRARKPGPP